MLKVPRTTSNETEYQLLASYAAERKLTLQEAMQIATRRLGLDDKVYLEDPIFRNVERASKPGKKTQCSVDHDKKLYSKP